MQYVEVLIAAVAAFMLGFGWYTFAFGKAWQAESGITDEQAQSGMAITHGTAFLMMCLIGMGLSHFLHVHSDEDQNFLHGAMHQFHKVKPRSWLIICESNRFFCVTIFITQ